MSHTVEISVVVPVYNEEENVPILIEEIAGALSQKDFEIVFVDDASTDKTVSVLKELKLVYPQLRVISHLKNCLLYTSPSPRDQRGTRMPSSA